MSLRLYVCMSFRFRGNVIFSSPIEISLQFFCVQIPLINENLFCKYFVRLSVGNATKGFATYGCFHPCFVIRAVMIIYCTYRDYDIKPSSHTSLFNKDDIIIQNKDDIIQQKQRRHCPKQNMTNNQALLTSKDEELKKNIDINLYIK